MLAVLLSSKTQILQSQLISLPVKGLPRVREPFLFHSFLLGVQVLSFLPPSFILLVLEVQIKQVPRATVSMGGVVCLCHTF